MRKKGLSPIIATVLLIVVAIALFFLVFFWIKSLQKETIMKQGTAIENICPQIRLSVQRTASGIDIINQGDVTIQKFEIIINGRSEMEGSGNPLIPGDTWVHNFNDCSGIIKIIPFLRGTTDSGGHKDYPCENKIVSVSC